MYCIFCYTLYYHKCSSWCFLTNDFQYLQENQPFKNQWNPTSTKLQSSVQNLHTSQRTQNNYEQKNSCQYDVALYYSYFLKERERNSIQHIETIFSRILNLEPRIQDCSNLTLTIYLTNKCWRCFIYELCTHTYANIYCRIRKSHFFQNPECNGIKNPEKVKYFSIFN